MPWLSLVFCTLWLPQPSVPLWVDRREGDWIVLVDQEETALDVPWFCLPAEVRPGDVVLAGRVDAEATREAWVGVQELTGGSR